MTEEQRAQPVSMGSPTADEAPATRKKINFKYVGCSRKCVETVVVVTVIAIIWGLMALPIIFYHLPRQEAVTTGGVSMDVNNPNISQCTPEVYRGDICRNVLQSRQSCLSGLCGSTDIFIPSTGRQDELEEELTRLLGGLQLLSPSPQCQAAVVPFLCFFTFGLCDSSTAELYRPSRGECDTIMTEICVREFQEAVRLIGSESLPQCQQLPTESLDPDCSAICDLERRDEASSAESPSSESMGMINSTESDSTNSSEQSGTTLCSDGFFMDEQGACIPECGVWEDLSHSFEVATDTIVIAHSVVYIISASVVLVLSCIQYERMFKFPAVFVVYEMFPLGLLSVSFLVAYTDRTKLYCTSRNLVESVRNPAPYCRIQGAIFHYIGVQQTLLWFFHIVAVFWGTKFPFHAKSFQRKGYFKHVHVAMLMTSILLPFVPVAGVYGSVGSTFAQFPAFLCSATTPDAAFYSFILPTCIFTAIGMTLVVLIFQVLLHVTQTPPHPNNTPDSQGFHCLKTKWSKVKQHIQQNSGELKVLTAFCYYSIFIVFLLTNTTIRVIINDEYIARITEYFLCEASPGSICNRDFGIFGANLLQNVTFVLIGFYPIANLIYVLNVQDVKQRFSKSRRRPTTIHNHQRSLSRFATVQSIASSMP